ncbi:Short chain dehydrogenase sol3 [Lachnellula suecica]|uniref:Short chain dehydrogenase sol3 n=1 Tax=Lachnellula suecica TaxID=602035 RepID=A0A8T9C6V4_9HELO|nr:Short chain dehydrogenase sol3 [Lachnellula suecica]
MISMGWFASFLYSQLFVKLPSPTTDFSGQTVIVTGSNTGLGLEAARHLSRLNASLIILAVRNKTKGEAAKKTILASTGRSDTSIEVWDLDMQSYDSIKSFCAKANGLSRLDGVIENAGIGTQYFKLVGGFESTITTNVIGTFLLAFGLLPKLRKSATEYKTQTKLSIVASDLHFIAKFPERHGKDVFASLNDEKKADMSMERYAVSKLLQVLIVRELGSRLAQESTSTLSGVIVNCITPGACKSDFDRESTGVGKFIKGIMEALLARTTEAGSRTLLAGVAAGQESQGSYMANCHVAQPGPMVIGPDGKALQKEIWQQLVRQLEIIQPGISQNV